MDTRWADMPRADFLRAHLAAVQADLQSAREAGDSRAVATLHGLAFEIRAELDRSAWPCRDSHAFGDPDHYDGEE